MNTDKIADAVGKGVHTGVKTTLDSGVSLFNWGRKKVSKVLDERQAKKAAQVKAQDDLLRARIAEALEGMELELSEEAETKILNKCRDTLGVTLHQAVEDAKKRAMADLAEKARVMMSKRTA